MCSGLQPCLIVVGACVTQRRVLLTAQSDDEQILDGYQKGADCYITKPLQPSALLNIVDYLIGDLPPAERAKLEPLL